ncbi:hypothetical protein FB567DRAFT_325255 [Paraphoma chrysanthemicola]|uniref:Uncharacterized protein n=1 Tax=Paraphoma chrysanthemicola TaxID=798071 RepID=A0A8K0RAK4_9PLEO|nr:hypothetical protein FB567DRAFT_325255 [Paraphoma chrysanthemicola]
MVRFITFLVGTTAFAADSLLALTCPPDHGPEGVRVRLPPAFDGSGHHTSWVAPPPSWYFKPWSMIYASNLQYAAFRNFQYDPTTIDASEPSGLVNDLTSFQLPGNDTIYTTYGVDTPHTTYPAVLIYAGTGILEGATSEYSMLAWGCDARGQPYYASYSTAVELSSTPAGIDIMSTSNSGPDEATFEALVKALNNLRNEEIRGLVATLTKMTQDGGRNGHPRVVSISAALRE